MKTLFRQLLEDGHVLRWAWVLAAFWIGFVYLVGRPWEQRGDSASWPTLLVSVAAILVSIAIAFINRDLVQVTKQYVKLVDEGNRIQRDRDEEALHPNVYFDAIELNESLTAPGPRRSGGHIDGVVYGLASVSPHTALLIRVDLFSKDRQLLASDQVFRSILPGKVYPRLRSAGQSGRFDLRLQRARSVDALPDKEFNELLKETADMLVFRFKYGPDRKRLHAFAVPREYGSVWPHHMAFLWFLGDQASAVDTDVLRAEFPESPAGAINWGPRR